MVKTSIISVGAICLVTLAVVYIINFLGSWTNNIDLNILIHMKNISNLTQHTYEKNVWPSCFVSNNDPLQPQINYCWPPYRSVNALYRNVPNTRLRPEFNTIVDNFWHLYHRPLSEINWSNSDPNILGGFGFEVKGIFSAPALPTCISLTKEKHLSHVLADSVASFTPYDFSVPVTFGGDQDFLQQMQRGVSFSQETPFARLPIFLWHRTMFQADVDGYDMFPCRVQSPNQTCNHRFVNMTEEGKIRFCEQKNEYSSDLEPETTCSGDVRPPAITYPYCNRETAPAAIISVDCLISESGFAVGVVIWNLLSLSGGGRVLSYNQFPGRWQLPKEVPLKEYDELACAGTSVYPSEPGHFFNEILPRLVHMDATLPSHIPLLWPDGALPERILDEFKTQGLISLHRLYVPTQSPSLHRARRMYVFASDYGAEHTPLLTLLGHATLQARIHAHVSARTSMVHNGVVVLTRGQSGRARSIANQPELLAALQDALPGVTVDAFEPTSFLPFLEVARRVYEARVIIGPHGANLNNIMGARPGTYVIELGYAGGMMMPSDFFCLARNLGLNYWLSPSVSGNYGSVLHVNVADVVQIARTVFYN